MSARFTLEGLKNLRQTGSLVKSSKVLAKNLADFNCTENKLVLELGAGEGVITKFILESLGKDCELHSYEINEAFIENLEKIQDTRLTIRNESVTDLQKHYEPESVDLIISCLPLANFKRSMKEELLKAAKNVLKPEGKFVQYQYSLNDFKLLKENFEQVGLKYCLRNLPPAFIYSCEV